MFITIEGIDGAGKTTQAEMLRKALVESMPQLQKNYFSNSEVISTREPSDNNIGKQLNNLNDINKMNISQVVRKMISTRSEMDPLCRLLLIYAARREHVLSLIAPALENNKIVICDRFYDSSVAYFGYNYDKPNRSAREIVDWLQLNTLDDISTLRSPDVTFLIDIEPETASKRISKRSTQNSLDKMPLEDLKKIRDIFLELAKNNEEKRYIIIDGSREEDEIHQDIFQRTINLLKEKGRMEPISSKQNSSTVLQQAS